MDRQTKSNDNGDLPGVSFEDTVLREDDGHSAFAGGVATARRALFDRDEDSSMQYSYKENNSLSGIAHQRSFSKNRGSDEQVDGALVLQMLNQLNSTLRDMQKRNEFLDRREQQQQPLGVTGSTLTSGLAIHSAPRTRTEKEHQATAITLSKFDRGTDPDKISKVRKLATVAIPNKIRLLNILTKIKPGQVSPDLATTCMDWQGCLRSLKQRMTEFDMLGPFFMPQNGCDINYPGSVRGPFVIDDFHDISLNDVIEWQCFVVLG